MSPRAAAEYSIRWFYSQRENIQTLDHLLFFTYEELTDSARAIRDKLKVFLPLLSDIRVDLIFNAHNFKNVAMPIKNLNVEKIGNITKEQLQEINSVFDSHLDLLQSFGYTRIA